MRPLAYVAVGGVVLVITALQLVMFSQPIARPLITNTIFWLAAVQAVLIALFYQHLAFEPKAVGALLVMALLVVLAFIIVTRVS